MSRITMTQLQRAVDILNETCGMPQQVWQRKENGETVSIPGCYVLDAAYGGYRLCQIVNTAGGERDITPRYPAGTAYDLIHTYMRGVINGRERHAKAAYRHKRRNEDHDTHNLACGAGAFERR